MWSRLRRLFTVQTLTGFLVAILLAGFVYAGSVVRQQYVNVQQMVSLFNTCLARPDCKALFVPAAPGK